MKLSSILIGGFVVSISGVAMGNGHNSAIQMLQKGYYHSHSPKLTTPGTTPKGSPLRLNQNRKIEEASTPAVITAGGGQTRLERAMLEQSLKGKPHLFSRWGKKVWGFFSFEKRGKLKRMNTLWKRAAANQ